MIEQKQHLFSMAYHQKKMYLSEMLANIDDALIATDASFIITNWNKSAERIYAIPAREAIGKKRDDLLHYDYLDANHSQIINELQTDGKWKGVVKYNRKDGITIYLQSSASVIKNKLNQVVGYVAVNRDITQLYLAEQSLQHFTAVMHSLHESFLIVDKYMKVVFLSPKKGVLRFHNSEYKIGDGALQFIPVKNLEEVRVNYVRAFNGETVRHEAITNMEEQSRSCFDVTYLPIKNSYGHITHVAVIIKDITDEKRMTALLQKQKEAETQLFHSRILFENFMQNCPLPAWVTDEDGVMQYMNPTYFIVTGFTKDDIGKTMYQLFPKANADEYYRHNAKVLESNTVITITEQAVGRDGATVTYLNTKFPLFYLGKKMLGGWAIDISKQVNIQAELEKADHFKMKLLSVISHDLRSPLTTVSALTSLVNGKNHNKFTKKELLHFLGIIRTSNLKTLALLDELRLWAQNKTNGINCEPKEIDVSEIISSSVDFLQGSLHEKSIQIAYRLQPGVKAFADMDMLKTIIRNLVSNAIKFSPLSSTITIHASAAGSEASIGVSDEGEGIENDIKVRILQGNNNTSKYGTNGEKGIGLGLAICKDFIDANKGRLLIENGTKGCTFSFTVPAYTG